MRRATARAATRRGCSTTTRPASARAGGTRVVLPAPGAATSTAARLAPSAARSCGRNGSIGERVRCPGHVTACWSTIPRVRPAMSPMTPREGDALIVVDVQNDFVTGSLAVPEADEILAPINGVIDAFASRGAAGLRDAGTGIRPTTARSGRGEAPGRSTASPARPVRTSRPACDCRRTSSTSTRPPTPDTEAYSALAGTAARLRAASAGCSAGRRRRSGHRLLRREHGARRRGARLRDRGAGRCLPCRQRAARRRRNAEAEMRRLGAALIVHGRRGGAPLMKPGALLTDLYELTMLQAYLDRGMRGIAVFEFFVRDLPATRNFLRGRGARAGARVSRIGALHRRRASLAGGHRAIHTGLRRGAGRPAIHGRRGRNARGHRSSSPTSPSCASWRRCPRRSWSRAGS